MFPTDRRIGILKFRFYWFRTKLEQRRCVKITREFSHFNSVQYNRFEIKTLYVRLPYYSDIRQFNIAFSDIKRGQVERKQSYPPIKSKDTNDIDGIFFFFQLFSP